MANLTRRQQQNKMAKSNLLNFIPTPSTNQPQEATAMNTIHSTSARQIGSVSVTQSYAEANTIMHGYRDLVYGQPVDADGVIVSDYESGLLYLPSWHPSTPTVLGVLTAEVMACRYEFSPGDSDPLKNEYTAVIRRDIATYNGAPKAVSVRWSLTEDSVFPQADVKFINVQLWGGQSVVRQEQGVFDGQAKAFAANRAYWTMRLLAAQRLNNGTAFEDLSEEERAVMTLKDGTRRRPMSNGRYWESRVAENDIPHSLAFLPYILGQRYLRSQGDKYWYRYGLILSGASESRRERAAANQQRDPLEVVRIRETFAERTYNWHVRRMAGIVREDLTAAPVVSGI